MLFCSFAGVALLFCVLVLFNCVAVVLFVCGLCWFVVDSLLCFFVAHVCCGFLVLLIVV